MIVLLKNIFNYNGGSRCIITRYFVSLNHDYFLSLMAIPTAFFFLKGLFSLNKISKEIAACKQKPYFVSELS